MLLLNLRLTITVAKNLLRGKGEAIQLRIWNGVMEGKLTPYNDLMTRIISIVEIQEMYNGLDSARDGTVSKTIGY